ncbi:class I SAM-dependent methyltransferase [Halobaculum sp. EA56]|uniref:class I SAM-dependent methyltransferase n=1 Tax=Halobaculum sp. EA56 TaxID=3421648 RepID=UPI003EC12235
MPDDPAITEAELYDLRHRDAEREDVEFYVDRAREADGPVLELACGTGRVHLPLLRAGVDADGVDLSAERLDRLRGKARAEDLDPAVREADMTALEADRAYDLAICPYNSLQFARTLPDLRATLSNVHDALGPGGRFVFDVFVPDFDVICETYGEWEETTVERAGETYTVRSRTTVTDPVEQLFRVERELLTPEGDVVLADASELAMLPKRLVEAVVDASPFAAGSVAGGFDGDAIAEDAATQVWTLERAGDG